MDDKALETIPGQDAARAAALDPKKDPLAEAKAKFEELVAKQKAEPDLSKPVKKAMTSPKEKPKVEVEEEEEEEEKPEKPAELTGTRQRLVLAGIPRKLVESLNDSEVGEVWKKQEEREQTAARALQRASELEKQLQEKTTSKSEPDNGVPTDELDLEEVASDLSDQFGEEESKAIAKTLAKLVQPLREENARISKVIDDARRMGEEQTAKSQRARLADKLPMLKDNDRAWESIVTEVRSLVGKDPKKFASVEAAFDDVFDGRYGEILTATPEPAQDDSKTKAKVAAGAMTSPTARKTQKTFTSMDAHRAAFKHLQENPDDTDGAKRAYGRYLVQ